MSEPVGPLGLRVGQRARRTQTVTAREVELYAQITGDRNPLHFDADFAARTRFGRLVAQGGDTLTAEVEVLSLKPDKPVCQLRATIVNQDGTVLLDGECWTYTLAPA
jgi:acyl dehydratase